MNKNFWIERLGEGWVNKLSPILKSEYMDKLMKYLSFEYDTKTVYPEKKYVFKCFLKCPWEKVRVVIIGKEPVSTSPLSNGLSFGNIESEYLGYNDSLHKIYETVEREIYNGLYLQFDWTLESWAKQGVLLLNTSLTVPYGESSKHSKAWNPFITTVINVLNSNSNGIIFVLWGKDAQSFKNDIKPHHYILTADHPMKAHINNTIWECDNFKKINEILTSSNDEQIKF